MQGQTCFYHSLIVFSYRHLACVQHLERVSPLLGFFPLPDQVFGFHVGKSLSFQNQTRMREIKQAAVADKQVFGFGKITGSRPYHYFPRGRVEIRKGRITVYIPPSLFREDTLSVIFQEFELNGEAAGRSIRVKADGSAHYQYQAEEAL